MNRWFHPEFETDLISAARYYNDQRLGLALGGEFVDEAEAAVEEVVKAPKRWPERQSGVRRYQLRRFPFLSV